MSERIVCVIQARMGSSRLFGKSLRPLMGRPLLTHVLERAKAIEGVDLVVLATSAEERDAGLLPVAWGLGCEALQVGKEWDVLGRVCTAAHIFDADVVVRVTGDCPLLAPEVGTLAVKLYRAHARGDFPMPVPYVTNDTSTSGYPDGTDVEVVSTEALRMSDDKLGYRGDDRPDREHVTAWVKRNLPTAVMKCDTDWSRLKLSVDSLDDLDRVQRLMARIPAGDFSLAATIKAATEEGLL